MREADSVRWAGAVVADVPLPIPAAPLLARVWPNPATGEVHVRFAVPRPVPGRLTIYDALGRRVRETALTGAGWQNVTVPLGLRPGRYVVVLEQQGQRVSAPLTVLQ